ncbi:nicotinate-nucleotide adenylyltransferase [Solirhodobacter olei]|uniref:nicotinate-nucleotide adenylyltransferase n=1 Tax=Solirhodobacter olei TaxID=2493082 RepID=UPI000FDAEA71|nr:nicotinate-nucleotide adenylyltransferase [Solirhodobacter olei]
MQGLPQARAGMAIGLLGGSFDPAHAGHLHISREALKRLGLDRVWWLVSPGNPLKPMPPAPMARRMAAARRRVAGDPRIVVSDLEARLGTRYTGETLERLMALYPGVTFVWLMGADNLAQFHLWERWRWLLDHVRIAVLARPGVEGLVARAAPAARRYASARVAPGRLLAAAPPAWCYLNAPRQDVSSSAIRARGEWRA